MNDELSITNRNGITPVPFLIHRQIYICARTALFIKHIDMLDVYSEIDATAIGMHQVTSKESTASWLLQNKLRALLIKIGKILFRSCKKNCEAENIRIEFQPVYIGTHEFWDKFAVVIQFGLGVMSETSRITPRLESYAKRYFQRCATYPLCDVAAAVADI